MVDSTPLSLIEMTTSITVMTTPNTSSLLDATFMATRRRGSISTFCFITNVIIDGCMCIVGCLCNTLAVIVLQKDRHKLSVTILLQGLAFTDTCFLLYAFFYTCLRSVYPYTGALEYYHSLSPYIVAYLLPLGWIFQTASIWIVLLVAVDRFIAVCLPFRAETWCCRRTAIIMVVITWVLAVLFNCPRFFYYHHLSFEEHQDKVGTFVAHLEPNALTWQHYRMIYHTVLSMVFLYAIPLPLLLLLNFKLLRTVLKARQRQLALTLRTKHERELYGTTINLIAVVTIFILCETPDFIAAIVMHDEVYVQDSFFEVFLCLKESLLIFNSSVNFIIYCLFYERFRKLLRRTLCGWVRPTRRRVNTGSSEDLRLNALSVAFLDKRPKENLRDVNHLRSSTLLARQC